MKTLLYVLLAGFVLLLVGQLYLIFWGADSYANRSRHLIGVCSALCGILLVAMYLLLGRIRKKIAAAGADQEAS